MCHLGIDLHKSYSYIVALDDTGKVIAERWLANDQVATYVQRLTPSVRVVFEATFNWQVLFERLEGQVAEIILVHPQ